jgi:hypothetical protein
MLTCHLLDEISGRLVNEVSFKFIPTGNQATRASFLQLEDGPLPAHEELLGMADLLDGPMVAFNGPVLPVDMHEVTIGDFHPLFFVGRIGRRACHELTSKRLGLKSLRKPPPKEAEIISP